ncbi:MAG: alkaline phosphatase family protein [Pirellulales bacterium]
MRALVMCQLILLFGHLSQAAAGVQHVIHISVDGLRGDYLQTRIGTSPLLYPNFKRFVDQGASTFNARTDFTHTDTLPNHTSMLTGRPVSQPAGFPNTSHHGYTNNGTPGATDTLHNSGNPNLSYVASTFDVAHDNGLSTALYASKDKFVIYDQSYTSSTGAVDITGANNGRDKIDTYLQE